MKRALIIGILGTSVGALSSFGQSVYFGNYSNASTDIGAPVKYAATPGSGLNALANVAVGSDFSAELLYLVAGNYVPVPTSIEQFGSIGGPVADGATGSGYTSSTDVTIVGQSGTVSMEWEAFNNTVIGGHAIGTITGISTPFTMLTSASSSPFYNDFLPLGTSDGNGGISEGGATGFNSFTVSAVPEPTTIALLGLGAAGLLGLRRRKA